MKLNLAVFFGGKSVEHEVSVITGLQAIEALDRDKYNVIPVYITKDNLFYTGTALFDIGEYKDLAWLLRRSIRVTVVRDGGRAYLQIVPPRKLTSSMYEVIDCALLATHGTTVEDGTLQGLLNFNGIPFTGCNVTASALGMDKYAAKQLAAAEGIPVLSAVKFYSREYMSETENTLRMIEEKVGYPAAVKPVNLGSSVGIKLAKDRESLKNAVEHALMFTDVIMAEHAVTELKEVNVSVLGDAVNCEASECEEPVSGGEILSYQDKYMGGSKQGGTKSGKLGGKTGSGNILYKPPSKNGTAVQSGASLGSKGGGQGMAGLSRKIPAEISSEQKSLIQEYGKKVFSALGASGVARLDFMIDKSNGNIYFNEINTIPGSLSFYLWEAGGLSYGALLDRLVSIAMKRERDSEAINFSFTENILAKF